ncbi:MAG: hypothetical protein K6U11_08815 [bacterium]|nr:hypothetical protein [bacterium]
MRIYQLVDYPAARCTDIITVPHIFKDYPNASGKSLLRCERQEAVQRSSDPVPR